MPCFEMEIPGYYQRIIAQDETDAQKIAKKILSGRYSEKLIRLLKIRKAEVIFLSDDTEGGED